jgi:aspartate-semialdehyde dehydrogenase
VEKKKVALIGATGIAGQQFIPCLENHPWFEITTIAASERSAGKTYAEAIKDPGSGARQWFCQEEPPESVLNMTVENAANIDIEKHDLIFSAIETGAARELESGFAQFRPVVSTASAYRYEEDVPLMLPGVNFDHAELVKIQQEKRGWKGYVVPIPNCTVTGLAITLKPIFDNFGLKTVVMTSMQAISGSGRSPGVIGLDIIDNILPYIPKEEEKVETEAKKILGTLSGDHIDVADFRVSATCTRAPILEGHTETVLAITEKPVTADAVKQAMRDAGAGLHALELPNAPKDLIIVHDDPFRPQVRLDRDVDGGMATTVGRVRDDDAFENGVKYMLVSHNTKMGAAKGAVLTAEYLAKQSLI